MDLSTTLQAIQDINLDTLTTEELKTHCTRCIIVAQKAIISQLERDKSIWNNALEAAAGSVEGHIEFELDGETVSEEVMEEYLKDDDIEYTFGISRASILNLKK